jgi:hypothetical protein
VTSNSCDFSLNQHYIDSKGRLWDIRHKKIRMKNASNGYVYASKEDDSWVCSKCGGEEPTLFTFIHDEIMAQNPTERLNDHDCDTERVRKIIES